MADEKEKQEVETKEEEKEEETTGETPEEPSQEESEQEERKPEKEEEVSTEEKEPEEADKPEEKEEDISKIQDKDEAAEALKEKGFDYAELQKEWNEKGDISKETRAKLAEQGISEEIVNNYIEGQKAKAEQEINELAETIGGRETFDSVIKWSGENLPADEINAINQVTDPAILRIILKDLKSRMEEKEGKSPEYTKGEGGKPAQDIYRSQAEMFEDIKNPKYKKDEAYRKDVLKKIAASREAGVDLGI